LRGGGAPAGVVLAFGYNYRGQLGLGHTTAQPEPQEMAFSLKCPVQLVACSYYHSVIVCSDLGHGHSHHRTGSTGSTGGGGGGGGGGGSSSSSSGTAAYGFGRNDFGQLGVGDTHDKAQPQRLHALDSQCITSVACGQYHTVLATKRGRIYSCGKNDYGQLGLRAEANSVVPALVDQGILRGMSAIDVKCGYYHTVALCHSSSIVGFGRNDYGQLGLGHTSARVSDPQVRHVGKCCRCPVPRRPARARRVDAGDGGGGCWW
jgi:alpha-tubulin suppressor-like RCC1 family protein